MPDSIRELLQGIAGDEPGPSRDLAAGAFRRARTLARRRLAATAVGVVAALALAGGGAAALIDPDRAEIPDPAEESTTVDSPTAEEVTQSPTSTPSDAETTAEDAAPECGFPDGWDGWGESDSLTGLDTLPQQLYFEVRQDDTTGNAIYRFDGEQYEEVLGSDASHVIAPDGERFARALDSECGLSIDTLGGSGDEVPDLGYIGPYCVPAWSPTSDEVVLYLADAETNGAYLLDVATGERSEVPAEVDCSPRWSADGQYLVAFDGSVAVRPDGSGMVELAGADSWTENEEFTGLSSISADLGRACLQLDDPAVAQSGHADANRCDRYVDTATGEELELPVATQSAQVVFLADGSMIVTDDQYGTVVVTLADADGNVLDQRTLAGLASGGTFLRGYYTG